MTRFTLYILVLIFTACTAGEKVPDKYNQPINRKSYRKTMVNKRILLYGDSISSEYYPWYKSSLQALSQASDIYPAGFSGYTTAMLAQDSQLQRIYDYKPDIIICLVGGNDTGKEYTVGTFGITDEPIVNETDINTNYNGLFFIQAVSHIIRKIEQHYPNPEDRPFIVFCTTLPQKRSNSFNPYSQPQNWLRKRDAIIECCNIYNIKCIDLYNLCDWDFTKEPYWKGTSDILQNRGIFTLDGLHPNEKGYTDMTQIIFREMSLE